MKPHIRKLGAALLALPLLGLTPALQAQDGSGDPMLLTFWDLNDNSDPGTAVDKILGIEGEVIDALYSPDGQGHTGQAGDRSLDIAGIGAVQVEDGWFINNAGARDQVTFSYWQSLWNVQDSSGFWAVSPSSNGTERGAQAHTPWSNNSIYFDTVGCCDAATQRISANATTFPVWTDES